MGQLTAKDVGAQVKAMNALYQPQGKCSAFADKLRMQDLVNRLRNYTTQVEEEADRLGLADDANVAQWALDIAHWRERLAGYQAALDEASIPTGLASCEEIYDTVVGPLLDGRFDKARSTAGIVNPAVRSIPDIATPYMLGNQVVVYREFQAENFEALIGYFIDEAKALGAKVVKIVKKAAPSVLKIGVGVALAALAVGYVASEMKKQVGKDQ